MEEAGAAALRAALLRVLTSFHGAQPASSASLGRMVNAGHWARVMRLLKGHGGEVLCGGEGDADSLYIAPTIILNPSPTSALMTEEVFGPLLSLLPVRSLAEGIATYVTPRSKPLALYVFSRSDATVRAVLAATSSGGVTVNDCVMHMTNPELPFGGVGDSGMGSYHGRWGFAALSHTRAVYQPWRSIDMGQLRYPPYTSSQLSLVRTLLTHLPPLPNPGWRDVLIAGLVVTVGVLAAKLHAATS